jgi:1-acyl-sn-glycerol-3-phosphate acyltransferase
MGLDDRARATLATSLTFYHSARGLAGLFVDKSGARTQQVALDWGKQMAEAAGVETTVEGLRPDVFDAPVVIMANHASHFDIPILLSVLPRCPGFLAKKELFKFPVFGPAMKGIKCVPIDRADRKQSLEAIEQAAEVVRTGGRLVVFPEGTRAAPGAVLPLHPGVAALASRTGLPVTPVVTDSGRCWGRRAFRKRPAGSGSQS